MTTFSFTKAERLLKRADFLRLTRAGKRFQNRCFIVNFKESALNRNRLGVTVSKRVGKAATRNRIKRLVREHYRVARHRLPTPLDINIIAKQGTAALSSGQVFASLDHIMAVLSSQGTNV